jgi:predicted amidohydrolase
MLAAITAHKQDNDANFATHVATLELAAEHSCDVVVFPEFSLTGSVDPIHRPEGTVAIDSELVSDLVAAAGRVGVAAVFGIAERAEEACYITQLYAENGELRGTYRKRQLGEDEDGYGIGDKIATFELGGVPFGIVICAEGGVDFTWSDAASAGAAIIFFCSAPGLYGRRTDEASWREGHTWWEGSGLGDARRNAQTHHVWVAMATQAGSTVDEDFPGLAALVNPSGVVIERTPDWRPATLLVDIPVAAR